MPKTTRRESRGTAFELLFEWSFKEESLDEIIEMARIARDVKVDAFALELAGKVIENGAELDSLIEQYSQGWKLHRISHTALTVLRMSFCEMTRFSDIPVGASINEAVELVKKFGTDEEAAYINGILGGFDKVRKGIKDAPPISGKEEYSEDRSKEEQESLVLDNNNIHKEHNTDNTNNTSHLPGDVELIEDIIIEVE